MNTVDMHADEITIDIAVVGRLAAAQFPQWADLPTRLVECDGWDNPTFRLGDDMSVRLPSAERYAAQVPSVGAQPPHWRKMGDNAAIGSHAAVASFRQGCSALDMAIIVEEVEDFATDTYRIVAVITRSARRLLGRAPVDDSESSWSYGGSADRCRGAGARSGARFGARSLTPGSMGLTPANLSLCAVGRRRYALLSSARRPAS